MKGHSNESHKKLRNVKIYEFNETFALWLCLFACWLRMFLGRVYLFRADSSDLILSFSSCIRQFLQSCFSSSQWRSKIESSSLCSALICVFNLLYM